MRWPIVFALGLCLAAACAPVVAAARSQPGGPSDAAIAAFVDDFVAGAMGEHDLPGASIVVVRDGRTLLAKGYGITDYDSGRAMSADDTLVAQGSTAKLLVWVLVMQLVEEGRLDLDADIAAHLDFPIPRTFAAPVTMRHLLTHTAGFSQPFYMVRPGLEEASLRDRLAASLPLRAYPPGEVVAYSNHGAALAAHVVERLRGERFEVLAQRRILDPLGMRDSTLQQPVPPLFAPRLASAYGALARTPQRVAAPGLPPAGTMSATARDMGRLLRALMGDGGASPPLLRDDTLAQMKSLQRPLVPGSEVGMGLGFLVGRYRGVAFAGHGGSMPAGATDLQMLPEHGLGWTISLTGRGREGAANPIRQALLRAVIARFFAHPPRVAHSVAGQAGAAIAAAGDYLPARRGHRGIVQLADLATVTLEAGDDGSLLVHHENGATVFLPQGGDAWREPATGLSLHVERDADGRVVRMASAFLNNATTFERAPLRTSPARWIVLFAPLLLLGLAAAAAVGALVRRMRRQAAPAATWLGTGSAPATRLARAAFAVAVATLLGWMMLVLATVLSPRAPVDWAWVFHALNALAVASVPVAGVLAWNVVRGWRSATGPQRAAATLAAAAASALAWLYLAFGFAQFTLAF